MKKIKLLFILAIGLLLSCASDDTLSDLNNDPKNPTGGVPDELFFSNAERNLVDVMSDINININVFRFITQYVSSPIYTQESQYNLQTRTIPSNFWAILYRDVLRDFQAARDELNDPANYSLPEEILVRDNRLAIINLLEVYTYSVLVDTFGDVPYTEALDGDNLTPVYDDAATIYDDLFTRIDESLNAFNEDAGSFGSADLIYSGDISSWIKFGNSLKLKLAMRIADANPGQSQTLAEEAAPNVFTSNEDNATLDYLTAPPNTNPLWAALVQSGRDDYFMANTIVDKLNELEDPRREVFFRNPIDGEFVGGVYGAGGDFETTSHFGDAFHEPDLQGDILDYSEVEFLLAEAAARGYNVSGTPEEHYNDAIRASFDYWGLTDEQASSYLSQPDVAYATAEGGFEQKIGVQFWIALFNRGFESWAQWRKFDYPTLNAAPQLTLDDIPVRFTYPIDEQNRNNANREAASSAIGGDFVTTNIFWDVE